MTHDQDEALELSDRVAILNHGLIEQVGTPDDVYDHPVSSFVCSFLGEANRLPVALVGGQAFFRDSPVYGVPHHNARSVATLYIRPHHLKLQHPQAAGLVGTVVNLRRAGAVRRIEVDIGDAIKPLDVDLASQVAPALGERVSLTITRAHVFSDAA